MDISLRKLGKLGQSAADSLLIWARLLMVSSRGLPGFIVVGTQKAGTTSFFQNIASHPQIISPYKKEVHYFDRVPLPPTDWYRAHFPPADALSSKNGITGEASPSYLLVPHVPHLVKELLPSCKFIALIRDPVKRAYSAYQFNARRNGMKQSFEEWIERDFKLLGEEPVTGETFRLFTDRRALQKCPVSLLRGIYIEQILFWHSVFPPEQLLILDSADYFRDPQSVLQSVATEFLGLEPCQFNYRATRNDGRPYPKMNEETEARLRRFFTPYNKRLSDYLGRDFGWV